ncbi:hypothetical protein HMPREF9003_2307 [Bifidobacterium dentium JCVIHMP022]|uniref:Uncharacterized protein n=1 Tax=Bifidobacterium dentium JCVIHMP022 TaxID=553191 RepID=A0AB72Z4X7_9BIFI|nr:hypothetical protein HMPREF9003_2307 [Bifidobacterium dentium JCVIHMP022]
MLAVSRETAASYRWHISENQLPKSTSPSFSMSFMFSL